MILNVSSRTDIIAFYTPWFINRLKEGFVDVRNPFYKYNVSRIYFSDVDAFVFCTKNPMPILPYFHLLKKPILFHVTLTPYDRKVEPNVPKKSHVIASIKKLSTVLGKENIYVRYDPIFINDTYTVNYHIKVFAKLMEHLDGYVSHVIVSFLDNYKNVQKNISVLKPKKITDDMYREIGLNFSKVAKEHNITVQTCCEEHNLIEYGFKKEDCISATLAYKLTGKTNFKYWKARGRNCKCIEMVDIGVYNSCRHYCKYCYANYNEEEINKNVLEHDINSSLLLGHLRSVDKIVVRK